MSRPSTIIRLRGIDKTFPNGTRALAGFDLDVRRGELLSLLGPSGCGIAGLAQPSDGTIAWTKGGEPTTGAAAQDIGFVFQEPTLMPWATVAGNVGLPLRLKGVSG